jgi:hypothetical protein
MGIEVIAPLILNLCPRKRWVATVSLLHSPKELILHFPFDRGLCGFKIGLGFVKHEKIYFTCRDSNCDRSIFQPVALSLYHLLYRLWALVILTVTWCWNFIVAVPNFKNFNVHFNIARRWLWVFTVAETVTGCSVLFLIWLLDTVLSNLFIIHSRSNTE